MKYDAVLFDMDGTILDTLEDMHSSVNAALRAFGMPEISADETRAYVGNGAARLIALSVPAGTDAETTEKVLNWYRPYYNDHSCILTKPYAGIPELLAALRDRGMKLAVVSNKPDETVGLLAELFFKGLFNSAVGESAGIRRKPAPDTVNAAVAAMGLPKDRCVYVGDSEVDVLTAKNAGLACIAVAWGFRSEAELVAAGAETIVHTPEELMKEL